MSYFRKHKEGFILTIVFHAIILLLLLLFGFFTPLPLPDEKGVLVDFGNSETGLGEVEPSPKQQPTPQRQQQTEEQTAPPEPVQPVAEEPATNQGDEDLMTQDFEETAAVDEGKKKAEEEARKKREAEEKKRRELEQQRRQEELQEQREAEELRRRLAEAEQRRQDSIKKIEEARLAELRRIAEQRRQDSIKRAEEQARIDAINSRAKNVFGNNTGQNENGSTSSGQGVTYGDGNQGTTTGTAGAERYGLGGGEGISFDLTGRSAVNVTKPTYPGQEEGVVVVRITVDKYGRVTKAEPGVKGSTSIESVLLNAAKTAALSTRFNPDNEAPAFQTGTITYRFVLD
ncbi:MAG: cell envelope integrity protein TolA [Prolixibacteraceae bacterium]|nr:cell envelope integrity protein TolA [Prolixibacteraceae bacterium]